MYKKHPYFEKIKNRRQQKKTNILEQLWEESKVRDEDLKFILNIVKIVSIIGFILGFFIFHSYFSHYNLVPQSISAYTLFISSSLLALYLFLFSMMIMFMPMVVYKALHEITDKDLIKKTWLKASGLFVLFIIALIVSIFLLSKLGLLDKYSYLIFIVTLLFTGLFAYLEGKYVYDFVQNKDDRNLVSFEFLFMGMAFYIFLFMGITDKEQISFFSAISIALTVITIQIAPYMYIYIVKKSFKKFGLILFSLLIIIFLITAPSFFSKTIVKQMHLGNILYKNLPINDSECKRIARLGYKCVDNNLTNVLGIWLQGSEPIFVDKNQTLKMIRISREKIQIAL